MVVVVTLTPELVSLSADPQATGPPGIPDAVVGTKPTGGATENEGSGDGLGMGDTGITIDGDGVGDGETRRIGDASPPTVSTGLAHATTAMPSTATAATQDQRRARMGSA